MAEKVLNEIGEGSSLLLTDSSSPSDSRHPQLLAHCYQIADRYQIEPDVKPPKEEEKSFPPIDVESRIRQ